MALKAAIKTEADEGWSGELDLDRFKMNDKETGGSSNISWADEILEAKQGTIRVWPLSVCKRCGDPLVSYVRDVAGIHSQAGFNFTTSVEAATRAHHIFYSADAETWTCLLDVGWGQPKTVLDRISHIHSCGVEHQLVRAPRPADWHAA